jgi:hypothetical protein
MLLEATHSPLRYRLKTGEEVTLRPGVPMELPDQAATQLLKKAPAMVRRVTCVPDIRPGACITWEGADLSVRHGRVDFLHTDGIGAAWAFCALLDGHWAAVNTKYVLTIKEGDSPSAKR